MTTPKEALERLRDYLRGEAKKTDTCYTCYTDQAADIAGRLSTILSSLEGDAVERVARIINPDAFCKNPDPDEPAFWRKAARHMAREKARAILATGLVPDEAAIRADEREKCETGAIHDIAAERKRQREVEGWTLEHDDGHDRGELAAAAACYAVGRCIVEGSVRISERRLTKNLWPWSLKWWKPKGRRRNLVRAATLIVAEIERIDRAAAIRSGGGE